MENTESFCELLSGFLNAGPGMRKQLLQVIIAGLASIQAALENFAAGGISPLKRVVQRLRLFGRRLKLDVGNDSLLPRRKAVGFRREKSDVCVRSAVKAAASAHAVQRRLRSHDIAGADAYFAALR